MVKNVLTLLLLGAVGLCHAQTLISPGGATVANASMSVSYSIGEIAITTLSDFEDAYTQGFQQPTFTKPVDECLPGAINVLVLFPNPVKDVINLQGQFNCFIQYSILRGGQAVKSGTFDGSPIDVSGLTPGIYFLHLIGKQTQFSRIIKFIKI
jgi:Secretion system C-terminal sorting domain